MPALAKRVDRWLAEAGGPSGGGLAATLEDQFKRGFYSDGKAGQAPSSAGHGVKRLTDLVTPEDMIGNDEQYASAMAVAAQDGGLAARVVLGFVVPDDSGVIKGTDVHAWVEVKLRRAGWVTFDPTPDKSRTPKQQHNDPLPEPQPAVLQPPVVPKAPNDLDSVSPQGAGKQRRQQRGNGLRLVVVALTYAGLAGVVTSPLWLLLFAKSLRRRTRRNADDVEARVSGGWLEILDGARDHGARLPASNTRYENSVVLARRFATAEAVDLAVVADRHLFGSRTPTGEDAAAYWAAVDRTLQRIRASAPAWRRPLAAVSPASIPWARIRDRLRARIDAVVARVGAAERVIVLRRRLARSAGLHAARTADQGTAAAAPWVTRRCSARASPRSRPRAVSSSARPSASRRRTRCAARGAASPSSVSDCRSVAARRSAAAAAARSSSLRVLAQQLSGPEQPVQSVQPGGQPAPAVATAPAPPGVALPPSNVDSPRSGTVTPPPGMFPRVIAPGDIATGPRRVAPPPSAVSSATPPPSAPAEPPIAEPPPAHDQAASPAPPDGGRRHVTPPPSTSQPAAPKPQPEHASSINDKTRITTRSPRREVRWQLVCDDGVVIDIDGTIVVGRDPSTRLVADSTAVPITDDGRSMSKSHAALSVTDEGLFVEDLHSTNGIRIIRGGNEHAVPVGSPIAVRTGDTLVLGGREFAVKACV